MGIVSNLRDALLEIKRIADDLSKDGTIDFTSDMRDGLELVIEFVEGGGSAEDFTSEQLDKVRGVVDAIAIGAAASAIVFVVGATGAVAVATVGGLTLVGVVLNEAASALLDSIGVTLVPDHIDYSNFTEATRVQGTNSLISGDVIISTRYSDLVFAYGGHDRITNLGGSDTIFAGGGQDTLDYSAMNFTSPNGIVLDASAGDGSFVVHHHSDTDVVTEVEHIIGTSVADAFVLGNYGANIAGGGHIESIEAGAGDDVALLLNEGGAGPRRVQIDGGTGIDVIHVASDGFNSEIDFTNGTVRYQGGVNAQFSIENFEAARGGDGSDVILGSDRAEYLLGNGGADHLFGGGADDFIFFDAADGANVHGGAGRDVAVALGQDGVTVDMAAQGLECVIGCAGSDTILVSGADGGQFVAGGGGSDTIRLGWYGGESGPRVLWGGDGADTFVFEENMMGGLVVVSIPGLTEERFANLTMADLNLDGLPINEFQAIIINPDASDRFEVLGTEYNTAIYSGDGSILRSYSSDFTASWLGRPISVQGHFTDAYSTEVMAEIEWDEMENVLSISWWTGTWNALGAPNRNITEYDPFDEADQARAMEDIEYYNENLIDIVVRPETHPEYGPWNGPIYVFGGTFAGAVLSTNGDLVGSLPDDPGPSPFDWLLAA